jgi:hypothetical protein
VENEIEVFLSRSIEDYTKSNPTQYTGDAMPAISAPVPKVSRMLRDGKGKFSKNVQSIAEYSVAHD